MTTEARNHECDGGACPSCGEPARLRECCGCGERAWIIDCGHYPQPRPIASGRRDGSHLSSLYCDDCADIETLCCEHCGRELTEREAEQARDVDGEMWCSYCYAPSPDEPAGRAL